ncbi:hypothetical protein B0H17DRAFT_1190424 [Mycena rosella]|uniref:Uncharacterized protein n=1 Tax=Mycena rosella TaxID=1033263 RepID=A0AAD7H2L4_MYCRO|nr:hypothetical protein B0H17DRAFT_1190424 [Mycena rosella]
MVCIVPTRTRLSGSGSMCTHRARLCSTFPTHAVTHLRRQLPAVTPLHPVLEAAILAPPSALDKPGALYVFDILAKQPNCRSAAPSHGRRYGWRQLGTPKALIHLHFKLLGAWMLPSECHFCGVRHTEKFGLHACGGRAGIAHVVVFYLRCLGWPVDE